MSRRIVLATFPEAQSLDVTGPLEVFSMASRLRQRAGHPGAPIYSVELVARKAGRLRTSSGLEFWVQHALADVRGAIDTLIVAGGEGTLAAVKDGVLVDWVRTTAPRARRVASVCSGAFVLAEAGLLDGRRATTHWGSCAALAKHYPRVQVEPDPIFVRDGRVWTSAGITAGMDLALALVEDDYGRELALEVARWLVFFLKRPGGQSQFSAQLAAQLAERAPLAEIQTWILEHPEEDLSVSVLARRCGMSARNFARVFTREVGVTPARFVENARVESARRRLEETDAGVEELAAACGFGSAETLRRAFLRQIRVSPGAYRSRFRREDAEPAEA
jgi:transcriptional regulator GlxA family with amidase domain